MDYATLHQHLTAQRWQKADKFTRTAILMMVERQNSWLREQDLFRLPPADLMLIDRLWRNYSNNRFGFSVQAQIWDEDLKKFRQKSWSGCERIATQMGWKFKYYEGRWSRDDKYEFQRDENIPYALDAPLGNLPSTYALGGGKSTLKYELQDTDSIMGLPGGSDRDYYDWSEDSFVGYDFLKKFYPLIKSWCARVK